MKALRQDCLAGLIVSAPLGRLDIVDVPGFLGPQHLQETGAGFGKLLWMPNTVDTDGDFRTQRHGSNARDAELLNEAGRAGDAYSGEHERQERFHTLDLDDDARIESSGRATSSKAFTDLRLVAQLEKHQRLSGECAEFDITAFCKWVSIAEHDR